MNTIEKNGYTTNKLEKGDIIVPKYDKVRTVQRQTRDGRSFDKHSLKVEHDGNEIYVDITPGQKKSLDKIGNLEGVELEAVEYTAKTPQGDKVCVGIRKKGGSSPSSPKPMLLMGSEDENKLFDKYRPAVVEWSKQTNDKDQMIASLVEQSELTEEQAMRLVNEVVQ